MEIEEVKIPSEARILSDQVKFMIVHYKNLGESNRKTAKMVGEMYNRPNLHPQTVNSVWLKYLETNSVDNLWSTDGRPGKMEEEDEKRLKRFFKKNPKKSISQAKVSLDLDAGRSTINRHVLELIKRKKKLRSVKIIR